jgi:hypothetical protein
MLTVIQSTSGLRASQAGQSAFPTTSRATGKTCPRRVQRSARSQSLRHLLIPLYASQTQPAAGLSVAMASELCMMLPIAATSGATLV